MKTRSGKTYSNSDKVLSGRVAKAKSRQMNFGNKAGIIELLKLIKENPTDHNLNQISQLLCTRPREEWLEILNEVNFTDGQCRKSEVMCRTRYQLLHTYCHNNEKNYNNELVANWLVENDFVSELPDTSLSNSKHSMITRRQAYFYVMCNSNSL